MGKHSFEVDTSNFQQVVLEGSKKAPVLVDFWAEWCAPCRALKPILEKLADEYQGRFVLAKINSDQNQALAAQFGVRGIPNVKAFVHGELRDEFSGAIPEAMVRQFIDALLPSPGEELRLKAAGLYREGRKAESTEPVKEALQLLEQAQALDPRNDAIRVDRAEILLDLNRAHEARELLNALNPLTRDEPRAAAVIAQAEFANQGADGADAEALKRRVAKDENDLEARLALARLNVARRDYEPALEQLLEIIRRDRGFGDDAGRKTMISVFNLLGNQGELVSKYRRLLASALN